MDSEPNHDMRAARPGLRRTGGLSALLLGCTALVALPPAAATAQAATEDGAVTLAPINVEGLDETGDENTIVATQVTSGSGLPTDLLDTAATVSVITAREIEQRNAETVEQVLQYSPAVTTNFYGSDDRFDYFRIRGFDAYAYRDGLRIGSAFGGVREETYAFERVEVVKGANSSTFGISDPGGMVNYVTKLPRQGRWGEVYGRLGNYQHKEAGFDFGDDLNPAGTLSYRITGKVKDAEKDYGNSRDDETFLMAGLTWRPSGATELSFVVDYLDRDAVPGSGGYPVGVDMDRDSFFGEPDFNYRGTERSSATLMLDHDFGGGLSLGASMRYTDSATDFGYVYVAGSAGGTNLSRAYFANDSEDRDFVADAHLRYDTSFGTIDSRTLFGVEYSDTSSESVNWYTPAPDIDYENPVYTGGIDLSTLAPYVSRENTQQTKAVYLQQELTFSDRFIANIGLRHDWLDVEQTNRLTGVTDSAEYSETTTRLGLTYKITPQLSAYGSYAESVVPASLSVEPERGQQYELGMKYRPAGSRAMFSAALFDLTKDNITRTNPATLMPETIGEVRVRGLEMEAKMEMAEGLSLTAGYSYLDSEIVENGTSGNEGNQVSFVPEHMASLWVNYTLPRAGQRGEMTFGLGARYTGAYWYDDANTQQTDGAVIYDASFGYALTQDLSLDVNVSNLLDEKHVTYGGFGADFYNPGRTVTATLRHSW